MESDKRNIGRDPLIKEGVYYIEPKLEARIDGDRIIVTQNESEDEKIRKEIIHYILYKADGVPEKQEHEWVAYLEKQKEQNHDGKKWIREKDYKEQLDAQYAQGLEDGRKEQKPNLELIKQSWYTEGYTDGKFKREPMWYIKTGKGGPRYEKNEKYGQPLEHEQSEWNEEDIAISEHELRVLKLVAEKDGTCLMGLYNKLKSLRPQLKQECSKEDEKIRKWLISYLENKLDDDEFTAGGAQMMHNAIAWLKKTEWGEEDETALDDLMWCIEQAKKSTKDENDMGNIWSAENWVKNRLKSLRPQSHWKPSKEQMKYLDIAIAEADGHKSYNLAYGLEKLKDNLKKL